VLDVLKPMSFEVDEPLDEPWLPEGVDVPLGNWGRTAPVGAAGAKQPLRSRWWEAKNYEPLSTEKRF